MQCIMMTVGTGDFSHGLRIYVWGAIIIMITVYQDTNNPKVCVKGVDYGVIITVTIFLICKQMAPLEIINVIRGAWSPSSLSFFHSEYVPMCPLAHYYAIHTHVLT